MRNDLTKRRSRTSRERADRNLPNPYSPASEGFEERSRSTVRTMPDGMIREDIGTPIT